MVEKVESGDGKESRESKEGEKSKDSKEWFLILKN